MNCEISDPALRIKMTGVCNRSCSFCNEEGDMQTIGSVKPTPAFFECVHRLLNAFDIKKVMLTGGEPTIHPDLHEIVDGIRAQEISVTTNGIRVLTEDDWTRLRVAGLRKVIVSIHDASPQSFLQLEYRRRDFGWAVRSLAAQKVNLANASKAGLRVRVNTVAYQSASLVLSVLDSLADLQREFGFDIRILNDLANIGQSQQVIQGICESFAAKAVKAERRAGSSNATTTWEAESGLRFSTKMAYSYYFDPICKDCPIKRECHEGFYGIRLERRQMDYWVRLCIYKHTPDVLMPWSEFLRSPIAEQYKLLCRQDQE